jgi:hypothetical protein
VEQELLIKVTLAAMVLVDHSLFVMAAAVVLAGLAEHPQQLMLAA